MFKTRLLQAALVASVLLGLQTVEAGKGGKGPKPCKGKNCPEPEPPTPPPTPISVLDVEDNGVAGSASDWPEFAAKMQSEGGDLYWKSYQFSTADNYGLTMFRIVGQDSSTPLPNEGLYGPIMLLHGFTSDCLTWFGRTDTDALAVGSQLALEGYDVWFANQRGSQFSKSHPTFSTKFDSEPYWDFDNTDIATRDIPAMLAHIKGQSKLHGNCKKTTVVGHSQGAQHILNGFSRVTSANRYVSQLIPMATCVIAKTDFFYPGLDAAGLTQLDWALWTLDIWSFFGPDWETEQVPILCALVGTDSDTCSLLATIKQTQGLKELSVKVAMHFAQNTILNRFQEYAGLWEYGAIFRTTPLIDISNIGGNIPVRFVWMNQDELCPIADQTPWTDTISSRDGEVFLDGLHGVPAGANDADFMTEFRGLLQNSAEEMSSTDCAANDLAWN